MGDGGRAGSVGSKQDGVVGGRLIEGGGTTNEKYSELDAKVVLLIYSGLSCASTSEEATGEHNEGRGVDETSGCTTEAAGVDT